MAKCVAKNFNHIEYGVWTRCLLNYTASECVNSTSCERIVVRGRPKDRDMRLRGRGNSNYGDCWFTAHSIYTVWSSDRTSFSWIRSWNCFIHVLGVEIDPFTRHFQRVRLQVLG